MRVSLRLDSDKQSGEVVLVLPQTSFPKYLDFCGARKQADSVCRKSKSKSKSKSTPV